MRVLNVATLMLILLALCLSAFGQAPVEIADHGAPVPAAENRGMTAAVDGDGNRVVLIWQMNGATRHQLVINAETGDSRQVPVEPFGGDNAFSVWHSSRDLWYSAYGSHFYEFDPKTLSFSFAAETPSRCAMSFHEDGSGIIWAALYPGTHLLSYNPETRELVEHGQMNEETWAQYPSNLAVDEAGWVYAGIGTSGGQVVAFNPATGERRAYVAQDKRTQGTGRVFMGTDGNVYGMVPGTDWGWHVLSAGEATAIDAEEPPVKPHPTRGSRSQVNRQFPDGSRIGSVNLETRVLVMREADGTERRVDFDYDTAGTGVAVMCAGPDGNIYGSTAHPSRLFMYEPHNDQLYFYPDVKIAFKSLRVQGDYIFGGHYSGGVFWLLDTSRPLTLTPMTSIYGKEIDVERAQEGADDNPLQLGRFNPNVNIPRNAFAHPDGKHIMISGQPGYGYVGGGLIIYNIETQELTELTHEDLVPGYSTMAIAALPDGNLLCGTSPRGGHGTTAAHQQASLYVFDWQTRQVVWTSGPLEQVTSIQTMLQGPDGLYYCIGGDATFVVFDAESKQIVHDASLAEHGRHTTNQAMIPGPDGKLYLALSGALLRITPGTFDVEVLTQPENGIEAGLGIVDGRIYFASRGRVMSLGL